MRSSISRSSGMPRLRRSRPARRSRQNSYRGGRQARNPERLAERVRADLFEPLNRFPRETGHPRDRETRAEYVDARRASHVRPRSAAACRYPSYLTPVSSVARSIDSRRGSVSSATPGRGGLTAETSGCFRSCAAVIVSPAGFRTNVRCSDGRVPLEPCAPLAEKCPALVGDEPGAVASLGQPQVGVVDAKEQAIFGARREHPVRLETTLGDQVVHENADVRLVAPERDGWLAADVAAPRSDPPPAPGRPPPRSRTCR